MKRKIVAQGNQSLTLTLPIKWVREQQLKAGDEIEVSHQGNELVLGKEGKKKGGTYKINLTKETANSRLLMSLIMGAYRSGADEIDIHFETPELIDRELGSVKTIKYIQDTVNLLIGISIVEQTKNYCRIKDITGASEAEFEAIFRRIFLLLLSIGEQSLKAFKEEDYNAIADIQLIYDSIKKFTEYCLRLLSKYQYKERENTGHFYGIVILLDIISDDYRHLTKHFVASNLSKPVIKAYEDYNLYLRKTYEWFYKTTDEETTSAMIKLRDISYKSIYSADSQKVRHIQNGGVLEALQAMRLSTTWIIRERMAMMK
jgi:phosphate uptake regulator